MDHDEGAAAQRYAGGEEQVEVEKSARPVCVCVCVCVSVRECARVYSYTYCSRARARHFTGRARARPSKVTEYELCMARRSAHAVDGVEAAREGGVERGGVVVGGGGAPHVSAARGGKDGSAARTMRDDCNAIGACGETECKSDTVWGKRFCIVERTQCEDVRSPSERESRPCCGELGGSGGRRETNLRNDLYQPLGVAASLTRLSTTMTVEYPRFL